MIKPLKNKNGFTMVELTVTMLILVIAMGLAASLILSGGSLLTKDSEMNAAKYIGDAVFSWVENRARYASHMTLDGSSTSTEGGKCMYIADSGRLSFYDGAQTLDVFGEEFYLGNTVKITAALNAQSPDDCIDLSVEVLDGGGKGLYVTRATVKLVNIPLENGNIIKTRNARADGSYGVLIFDNNRASASGGYSDSVINDLAAVCQQLADAINRLNDGQKLEQIKAILGSGTLNNETFCNAVKAELGGSWPGKIVNNDKSTGYAKPYFIVDGSGYVKGIIYYADSNQQTANANAKYVYDTRADCWYVLNKGNFKLTDESKYGSSYETALNYIESGTSTPIGEWSQVK